MDSQQEQKKQPASVLTWHREAAEDMRNYFKKPMLFIDIPDPLHAMIAQRDSHAETVRLLEELDSWVESTDGYEGESSCLRHQVRTHLAKLKGTQ